MAPDMNGATASCRTGRPLSEERLTVMSNPARKRGFVAAQAYAVVGAQSASAAAVAALREVNERVDAWHEAHEGEVPVSPQAQRELDAIDYKGARDRVFATPALTPQDLAAKIATIWEFSRDIEWHPGRDDHREIVAKGGDADHALLACYLDAMSLAGAVPDLSAPSADLADLIEELRVSASEWGRAVNLTDEVLAEKEGRRITAKDERTWSAASERHHAALSAVMDYRPHSARELALKASAVVENSDTYFRAVEYDFALTYQRDAEHLARIEAGAIVMKGSADRQRW